jgi:hypothetical protein
LNDVEVWEVPERIAVGAHFSLEPWQERYTFTLAANAIGLFMRSELAHADRYSTAPPR